MKLIRMSSHRYSLRAVPLLLALAALSACSGYSPPAPAPLEALGATVAAVRVPALWQARVGAVGGTLAPLRVGTDWVVPQSNGQVSALNLSSGKTSWSVSFGRPLTAGVGSDGQVVAGVTGSRALRVLAASGASAGQSLWTVLLDSEVVTPPLVAGGRVFVLMQNQSVAAYDALTGRYLWLQKVGDRNASLALEAPGLLMAQGGQLLVGLGPVLARLDPNTGAPVWSQPMSGARASNEIERLAVPLSPALTMGRSLCLRLFDTGVQCLDAATGQPQWQTRLDGAQGLGGDANWLLAVDGSDRINAWQPPAATPTWRMDRLLHRNLTSPVLIGNRVVVGDGQGYVHILDVSNGQTVARISTGGGAVRSVQVGGSDSVLVLTTDGQVAAYRVR